MDRKSPPDPRWTDVALRLAAFEHTPYIITFIDRDYCIRYINRLAEGSVEEAILGRSVFDFVMPAYRDLAREKIDFVLDSGRSASYESQAAGPSGPPRWFENFLGPIVFDGEVAGVSFTALDITDRMELEAELARARNLESLGVLAGGIAHDFNNILTALWGNLQLMRLDAGDGLDVTRSLAESEAACVRAQQLTRQLLTFAKGGALVIRVASMAELLRECADFSLRGSKTRCTLQLQPGLWAVEIDSGQMSQVIGNILLNARQAMPRGGTIEIHAENVDASTLGVSPLGAGRHIRVAFHDHGVGIAAADLPKIFDPFFTTKERGTGLGLATCHSIVRRHGGLLRAHSTPGEGTTMELYLPATKEAPAVPAAALEPPARGRGRILVMDDEAPVRAVFERMLGALGYEVDTVHDGQEAITAFRRAREVETPYSLVILDLTIPGGIGGHDIFEQLLAVDPLLRGIVTSGYSDDPVLSRHREYGFRAALVKPFAVEELGRLVSQVLSETG